MLGIAAFCIFIGLAGLGVCGILLAYLGIESIKQTERLP